MAPGYARAAVFCVLLAYVLGASAASFFSGRQVIWFEGQVMCVKKTVPLQFNPVRRIPVDGSRQACFRALAYPRDACDPEYRPARMPRLALGDPGLEGTYLGTALTLAEARELASVLDAVRAGRTRDSRNQGAFWGIESVE